MAFGLTGGIASGKSLVADQFESLGARVIDTDKLGHELIAPSGAAYREVVEAFGSGICRSDGTIDRSVLAAIVFKDRTLLDRLNHITHPKILALFMERLADLKRQFPEAPILCEAPLLYETNLQAYFRKTILVYIPANLQVERLIARDGLTVEQARIRITAQLPIAEKVKLADYIIDNSRSIEDTRNQVIRIYGELRAIMMKERA